MRRVLLFFCLIFILACDSSNNNNRLGKSKLPNDTISGLFNLKYISGQVKETGMLIRGNKNGIWKSFDENGNLLSAVYFYKNEKVIDLDKEDFLFNKVKCEDIAINLPKNWTIRKNYKQTLLLAVKPNLNKTAFDPTINVLKVDIPVSVVFSQFIIANKRDLVNTYKQIKFKEEKEFRIAENAAYEMLYFVKVDNKKLAVLSTFVQKGNRCYIITCIAEGKGEEFVKYNDLFKEITLSFNFQTTQSS
jgi:acid phosphatase class B